MSDFEIVSHPLCPHAQRIVLLSSMAGKAPNVDYRLTLLEYSTLPVEAKKHSENGELPVLKLAGAVRSSSTDHIAEYLNGALGLSLLPAGPDQRLRVRSVERLANTALDRLRTVFVSRDAKGLEISLTAFFEALEPIEKSLSEEDVVDLSDMGQIALAPIASLTAEFDALRKHARWSSMPRLAARMEANRGDERVLRSRCREYAREFEAFFSLTGSSFPRLVATH